MGKILTPAEFQRRILPKEDLSDFDRVMTSLERRVNTEPSIIGGLLYGSGLYRGFSLLSDVDCVILYLPQHRLRAFSKIQEWVKCAHSKHIKASPIMVDLDIAQNGLHSFGPLFWDHLQNCAQRFERGCIKQNPLLWFRPPARKGNISLKETELNYFRFKLSSLYKSWVRFPAMDESSRFRFYQKAMEAPMHSARKVLELKINGYGRYTWEDCPVLDSKRWTEEFYEKSMPAHMSKMLNQLVKGWQVYITQMFGQMTQPGPNAYAEYQQTLDNYLALVPTAIEFVRLNALYVEREL